MNKYRELKQAISHNGQKSINGKPVSFLLSYWSEEYEYSDRVSFIVKPITFKVPTNVAMYISLDADAYNFDKTSICENVTFYEDILLRYFSPIIKSLNDKFTVINKLDRLNSRIVCEEPDCRIIRRSGMLYDKENNTFIFKLGVLFPTGAGVSILGNRIIKMLGAILTSVEESFALLDYEELNKNLILYKKQKEIREYCEQNNYKAFIANGSIIPRVGDTQEPLNSAIPFKSPSSLQKDIKMFDGTVISGMVVPSGITVITGAGFSGKTTLLQAIQSGIYNYIPGDGREFVLSNQSLMVTNSEDGRYIDNENISLFFNDLAFADIYEFSTKHASGSVSQATNIIESIYAGSQLITIDEDKSATNFMIRDNLMRQIVKNEVIIPFTDRIKSIYKNKNVSVIMVIGGSSEYLKIADTIILLDKYLVTDITEVVKSTIEPQEYNDEIKFFDRDKMLCSDGNPTENLLLKAVCTEDSKKVICGKYTSDMTMIPSIESCEQLQTIARAMRKILSTTETESVDLRVFAESFIETLFDELVKESKYSELAYRSWWFDEIRKEEIIMAILRLRGIHFSVN